MQMRTYTHTKCPRDARQLVAQLRQQAKRKVLYSTARKEKVGEERGAKRKEGAALESYALPPELTPLVIL